MEIGEPAVNFLLQSTWKEAALARAYINDWYQRFPNKESIAGRLRAEEDVDHYGAIDELFVHQELERANPGAEIRYEEHGRGPDFRIYSKGSLIGAIEVASFFMREDWQRQWRNYGYIADALNERLTPKGLYLQVEPETLSRYPQKKQLARFANKYIESVEELVPYSQDQMREPFEVPASYFTGEGFSIRFQLLPYRKLGPVEEQDSVASVGPAIGGMVNSSQRLRGVLRGKLPGRYQLEPVPYVIAVVNHDMFCSVETLMTALYGSESEVFNSDGNHGSFRAVDGFFGRDAKHAEGKNRRVSGIQFITDLAAWNPHAARSFFFTNPLAASHWPQGLLAANHRLTQLSGTGNEWGWNPPLAD